MIQYEELNPETVRRYRSEIARFYYGNMQTCSCLEHFTFEQAYYQHPFREELRMYVNECSVKEGYRGLGIGSALIALVEARAKQAGLPAVYLHAEAGSADALRFYESNGYREERIQFRKEIL